MFSDRQTIGDGPIYYVLVYPFFVKDKFSWFFFGLLFSTEVFSTLVCLALFLGRKLEEVGRKSEEVGPQKTLKCKEVRGKVVMTSLSIGLQIFE